MIRSALIAVEDWIDDESFILGFLKFCLVFVLVCAPPLVLFVAWVSRTNETEAQQCIASGKGWAIIGQHQGMMLVGKVMVPHTYTDYGCVEVKR